MPWETEEDKTVSIEVLRSVSLDEVNEFRENFTTHLVPVCHRSYTDFNLCVFAGEGAHGSEGFVAVTQITAGQLVWLAYFDCSNPFEKVALEDGIVMPVSNL